MNSDDHNNVHTCSKKLNVEEVCWCMKSSGQTAGSYWELNTMKITKPWNELLSVTSKVQSKCGKSGKKVVTVSKVIKFTSLNMFQSKHGLQTRCV